MNKAILRFTNILITAILAGVSFGIWMGANPMNLTQATYLEQQQNTVRSLQVLMISLVVLGTVVTIISLVLQREERITRNLLGIAALCLVSCIFITRFGNLPIDNAVMSWTPDSMPINWTDYRDTWWSFHGMRTLVELVALFLVVWSSVRPAARIDKLSN